jgi:hypothetical protein
MNRKYQTRHTPSLLSSSNPIPAPKIPAGLTTNVSYQVFHTEPVSRSQSQANGAVRPTVRQEGSARVVLCYEQTARKGVSTETILIPGGCIAIS